MARQPNAAPDSGTRPAPNRLRDRDDRVIQFVFVLEPGFTMHAFSSAVEVLRLARKFGGAGAPAYSVASLGNEPVHASNGIAVMVDRDIDDLPRRAILVIVSGADIHVRANPKLVARLRCWHRQGHPIWAISSGVVRLAQSGLADGIAVSAHWEDIPYLKEHHSRVGVSASLFIGNSRHPTCSGGGAAADLMMDFIAREMTAELVRDIASRLVIDGARDGRLSQSLPVQLRFETQNPKVLAALEAMNGNIRLAISTREIADRVGISLRQLERLFNAEFGKPPAEVYRELRFGEARQNVIAGRRPLNEIAWDFGFEPAQFARGYRQVYGVLPSVDRKARTAPMSHFSRQNGDLSTSCSLARR